MDVGHPQATERVQSNPQQTGSSLVVPRSAETSQQFNTANSSGQQNKALVEAVTAAVQTALTAEMDGIRKMLAQQQQTVHPAGTSGYSKHIESIAVRHGINLPPKAYSPGPMVDPIQASADPDATLSRAARRRKHRLQELDTLEQPTGKDRSDLRTPLTPVKLGAEGLHSSASALRVELQQMKLSALRKRALGLGVSDDQLDDADESADRKEEMIRLVLDKVQGVAAVSGAQGSPARLRTELGLLKTSALRLRAMKAGVSETELDAADDQHDCRSALIDLIIARSR